MLYKFVRNQIVKFALVGIAGAAIHFSILYFLTSIYGMYYMVSAIFAAVSAAAFNYTLNKLWTFRPKSHIISPTYDYDAYYRGNMIQKMWKKKIANSVWEMVPDTDTPLLDIGCGSSPIITKYPGATGIDNDYMKIKFMRERFGESFRFEEADVTDMKLFKNNSFSRVICAEVLEHVDAAKAVKEISRVTSKNGIAVIATPDFGSRTWKMIERLYGILMPHGYHDDHVFPMTESKLINIMKENGFMLLRMKKIFGADMIASFIKV